MKKTIRTQSDKEQLSYISHLYNYSIETKFKLLEIIAVMKKKQQPYDVLLAEVQELTTEIKRLDESRHVISHAPVGYYVPWANPNIQTKFTSGKKHNRFNHLTTKPWQL